MIDVNGEEIFRVPEFLLNPKLRFLSGKLWKKITRWFVSETTDLIVRKAIVADTLMITMYELHAQQKLRFDMIELLRFVPAGYQELVRRQLIDDDINELFEVDGDDLRIVATFEMLHAAMQYCGVFYPGFIEPVNPPVPRLEDEPSTDVMDAIETFGLHQVSRLRH